MTSTPGVEQTDEERDNRYIYQPEDVLGIVAVPAGTNVPLEVRNPFLSPESIARMRQQDTFPDLHPDWFKPGAMPPPDMTHFSTEPNESREDEEIDFESSDEDLTDEDAAHILATARQLVQDEDGSAFSLARLFAFTKKKGERYERALRRIQAGTQAEIDTQINAWKRGNAPADTVKRIASILRKAALTTAQLGKLERGEDSALSPQEQKKARVWANQQQNYLKGVYKKMRETLDAFPALAGAQKVIQDAKRREAVEKTAGTLKGWRLPLYVNGLRAVYEISRARFPVEIFPRSGATTCLVQCQCHLEWEEDDEGPYVNWVLGEVKENHCEDCPSLASHSPYRQGEL